MSSTVKDLVAGSGLSFEDAGEHELKGVPDTWHLYPGGERMNERPETEYAWNGEVSLAYQVDG